MDLGEELLDGNLVKGNRTLGGGRFRDFGDGKGVDEGGQLLGNDQRRRRRHGRLVHHLGGHRGAGMGDGTKCGGGHKTAADEEFTTRYLRHLVFLISLLRQARGRREDGLRWGSARWGRSRS